MAFDRDGIKNGTFKELAAAGLREGSVQPLSDEERLRSRIETVAARPPGAGLWVFGYGSLMWNPAFHYVETRRCKLYGFHRAFCLQTPIGRGTKDYPGLVLGLDRGGSVNGIAFRVTEEEAEEELDIIWAREMLAGSYRPTWVKLHDTEAGGYFHAMAFVMRRDHERYTGRMHPDATAERIANACGPLGPCREYLENTVSALDSLGIADGPMHDMLRRVRAISPGADTHDPGGGDRKREPTR